MTGKTHQLIGVSAGLTYYLAIAEPVYGPATFGTVLTFSYFAALLPDIDQPTGKIWQMLPIGRTLGQISDPFIKHRNITHSLLGAGLMSVGLYYLLYVFPPYWGIDTDTVFTASLLAYLSHLFADMWTVEGIPLFFPYKRFFGLPPKPFEGVRIATGKWFENFVIIPTVTLFVLIFILVNLNDIKKILFK